MKPPYVLPSMADIVDARGSTGLRVASTFAGCGGSCLGFEMAGFAVDYANEFVPAARDTYLANHPGAYVDARDIRQVKGSEILEAMGLELGDLDVLNGSPPCASFSMAGKRSKGWGQVKKYSDTEQRTDDLFYEYVRLVDETRPRVFIAENVTGLVRGKAVGYFKRILEALLALGYDVVCRILDAQWLGVPQMRTRTIFVGVRSDLGVRPAHPKPLSYFYSIRDAIPWIETSSPREVRLVGRSGYNEGDVLSVDAPSPCIMASGLYGSGPAQVVLEKGDFHPDDVGASMAGYAVGEEWKKLKPGEQSEKYFNLVRTDAEKPVPTVTAAGGGASVASVAHPFEQRKFTIRELKRLCSFPDDFVLTGSYMQQWERLGRAVPPRMMCMVARTVRDEIFAPLGRVRPGFREVF